MPDEETLHERRKRKFVIHPKDVEVNDDLRVRQWGLGIMKQYVSKLNDKVRPRTIVYQKEVEPEEIDIRNIYPFEDMYWMIFKHQTGPFWVLRLCYRTMHKNHAILAELTYANIDGI